MRSKGTGKDAARWLLAAANALEKGVAEVEREVAKEALSIARSLSSGGYSSQQLAGLGHPYAAARPQPPADPAIINKQTGAFFKGWRIERPRVKGYRTVTALVNASPNVWRLLRGTARMIPRPYEVALRARLAPVRARIWRKFLDHLFR